MKVLFVLSGNIENFGIMPFVKNQGESLKKHDIIVDYFPVREKGIRGYFKYGYKLRKYLRNNRYEVIHAHYVLCGWTAVIGTFGSKIPIVLSLMGDDAYGDFIAENKISRESWMIVLLSRLIQPFMTKIISKSKNIENTVYLKNKSVIIPNGIDTEVFHPNYSRKEMRALINLRAEYRYILFLGDQNCKRKNIALVKEAYKLLKSDTVKLLAPYPVEHKDLPKYLTATDILVFTSFAEGSPNIIKEAMACDCPIVSTNVGDVEWVFGSSDGCFLTTFNSQDVSEKIKIAISYAENENRTKGHIRIRELGLDSNSIAKKIIGVYEEVIE